MTLTSLIETKTREIPFDRTRRKERNPAKRVISFLRQRNRCAGYDTLFFLSKEQAASFCVDAAGSLFLFDFSRLQMVPQ